MTRLQALMLAACALVGLGVGVLAEELEWRRLSR